MLTTRALARINNRPRRINRLPLAVIGAGSLALGGVLFVVASSLSLAVAALAGELAIRFAAVSEACKDLASSERIWRLSEAPGQRNLKAGDVSFQPEREPAQAGLLEKPGIRANIPIWGIDAGD